VTADSTFHTRNLGLAALLRVEVDRFGHGTFVFEDEHAKGPELEVAYLTRGATVAAAEFHRQLRVLRKLLSEKAAIHTQKRGNSVMGEKYKENEHVRNHTA